MEYLGTETGGRFFPTDRFKEGMVLFSFGVGEDISFELEAVKHGVRVYCFDPTPKASTYIATLSAPVEFRAWGLADTTEIRRFYLPENPEYVSCSMVNLQGTADYFNAQCYCLDDIKRLLKVEKIDILKLDIEGEEYAVIDELSRDEYPEILMVEFHPNGDPSEYAEWLMGNVYTEVYQFGNDYLFL
jgi:FkbM family methyltransferase